MKGKVLFNDRHIKINIVKNLLLPLHRLLFLISSKGSFIRTIPDIENLE